MPENTITTTELTSQYIAQVSGDLDRNVKEQERVEADIAALQEQLATLQRDHTVLVNMREALGVTQAQGESAHVAEPAPVAEPAAVAVPAPRKTGGAETGRKQRSRKPAAAKEKSAAGKPAAKAAEGAAKSALPTLVELIRGHLADQGEPRSAAEISTALGQAHPERQFSTKVVRVTLEGLVAKSRAQRTKQGKSVFYSAPDATEPTAEAQPDASDS